MDPFEDLMADFGKQLDLVLKPDTLRTIRLKILDDFYLQVEQDSSMRNILFGCLLGELPAGTYRRNILRQAMITNGLSNEPKGILAFSPKKENLVLFQFFPIKDLDAEKLYHYFQLFIAHAKIWITSLRQGIVPQLEEEK